MNWIKHLKEVKEMDTPLERDLRKDMMSFLVISYGLLVCAAILAALNSLPYALVALSLGLAFNFLGLWCTMALSHAKLRNILESLYEIKKPQK